jgi:uncharacterized damage-inducible protein DinB
MTSWTAPEIHRTEALHDGDELSSLREFLQWHRDTLISKCSGLTGEQLMLKAVPTSQLTLLGLVRHLAEVERGWFRRSFGQDKGLGNLYCTDEYEDGDFDLATAEGAEADFVTYFREVELADAVAAGRSLDDGFPGRTGLYTLRFVYLHMIEEYARHNGHADLLREAVDGATGE